MHTIIIELDNTTYTLESSNNDDSILELALNAGLDAPYSCQGGVCTTCKAKLKEGKVEMISNFALTDREVASGYILTCQAHATTDIVSLSYDQL